MVRVSQECECLRPPGPGEDPLGCVSAWPCRNRRRWPGTGIGLTSPTLCRHAAHVSTPRVEKRTNPEAVDHILRSLPDWFGIEEAIQNYVNMATSLDSFIAMDGDQAIGVALIARHFPESAELALIAVHAEHRSAGIGRQLVTAAERDLRAHGCLYLEVHTVGPSYDDEHYATTRAFYRAVGFAPMHEFDRLDWDGPTLILVKKL